MKYEFHPASCRHEHPTALDRRNRERHHHQHDFDHLEHLAQLEQMQLQANHQSNGFHFNQQHYLTIEDIKSTRNSCWLCGCNWLEDHVSLDCPECGGYALSRPCPSCDGKCQQRWTRNISATHDRHKALWVGQCKLQAGKQAASCNLSEAERFKAAARAAASMITSNKQQLLFSAAPYQPGARAEPAPTQQQQQQQQQQQLTSGGVGLSVGGSGLPNNQAAPSSCCSSQPSSAASSDEEPDDLAPK